MTARSRFRVVVTNVPDDSVEEVAVPTLALLLSLVRRLPDAARLEAGGGWGLTKLRPIPGRIPPGLTNLLVTPHMAYYSGESIAESQRKAAARVIKVLTGGNPDYPVRA